MRVRGSVYNGPSGDVASGATVRITTLRGSYSAQPDDMGQWELTLPGNPGITQSATLAYAGRVRQLFAGERRMGIGPSWDPHFWLVLKQSIGSTSTPRVGVAWEPDAMFGMTHVGGGILQVEPGCVVYLGSTVLDDYWISSWEEVVSVNRNIYSFTTDTYVSAITSGTYILGVEHDNVTQEAVFNYGTASGNDVITVNATHTGALLGAAGDFVPLARVTFVAGSITNIASLVSPLFEGRAAAAEPISIDRASSASVTVSSGDSLTYEYTGPTFSAVTAGRYVLEYRGDLLIGGGTGITAWNNVLTVGSLGSGTSPNFNSPGQVAVDSSGYVYVADYTNNRVVKLDSSGAYVSSIALGGPCGGVAVDSSDNVYTLENPANDVVRKFNSSHVQQWAISLTGSGRRHLATDGTTLWSTSPINNTVTARLCSTGAFSGQFGGTGSGNGQFLDPYGIATDGTYVYVSDDPTNRLTKFTVGGVYVTHWSVAGQTAVAVTPAGDLWVAGYSTNALYRYSSLGSLEETLSNPTPGGVAALGNDIVWATSVGSHSVSKWQELTDTDGDEWADLVVTPDLNINGVWQSLDFGGSDEALGDPSVFASRPEALQWRGTSPAFDVVAGDETLVRSVVSIPAGEGVVTGASQNWTFVHQGGW